VYHVQSQNHLEDLDIFLQEMTDLVYTLRDANSSIKISWQSSTSKNTFEQMTAAYDATSALFDATHVFHNSGDDLTSMEDFYSYVDGQR